MKKEEFKTDLRPINDELMKSLNGQETKKEMSANAFPGGKGTGPDDCMYQDVFETLSDNDAIKSPVYVCGWGWTNPPVYITPEGCGCGCGCGEGSGCGCGEGCGCGCGCGSGEGSGCGSGEGCGYGSGEGCGYGSGEGCGYGSGEGCGSGDEGGIELMNPSCFSKYKDSDKQGCLRRCKEILRNYGIYDFGSLSTATHIATKDRLNQIVNAGNNIEETKEIYRKAIHIIKSHLSAHNVLIAGVCHSENFPGRHNSDGTDHFIVITGYHFSMKDGEKVEYFTFMDPASSGASGYSLKNRLYIDMDMPRISGFGYMKDKYILFQVRPHKIYQK